MPTEQFLNNAQTTVGAAYTAGATTLVVADGSKLPALTGGDQFHVVVFDPNNPGNAEIMLVTARAGNTLTVTPAAEAIGGAQASHDHAAGETVANELSVASLTALVQQLSLDQAEGDLLYAAISHTHTFASLTSKPTTLVGYGITDAQPLDATLTALAGLTITANSLTIGTGADAFSQVTFGANTFPARASTGDLVAKTISDFALTILDDANAAAVRATIGAGTSSFSGAFADLTSKPTTLSGYGITDAQPLDAQLTSLAGLVYTGNAGRMIVVNATEDGFTVAGTTGDVTAAASLTDNAIVRGDGGAKGVQTSTVQIDDTGRITQTFTTPATITQDTIQTRKALCSGTPGNNFGFTLAYQAQDGGGAAENIAQVNILWATVDHATRKARIRHFVYDAASFREYLRGESSGTAPMVGFLGAAASAQLVSPDAGTALVTFGLASGTPTFAWANLTSVPSTFAPSAHATSHQSGGSDAIKLDDLAAPDDNADLNASTTKHGLEAKAVAPAAGTLNVLGIAPGETARADKTLFDTTNPEALGTAAPGTAIVAARRDHVHTLPKLDDLAAPDDNTDLNASTSAHGLLKKLSNVATEFMNGAGAWAAPAGTTLGLIVLQDQKAQNTDGGTFTSGAWRTRTLNTEVVDTANDCSLSSNQFTLTAGTYEIIAFAPSTGVDQNQAVLYNATGAAIVLNGSSEFSNSASGSHVASKVVGRFTVAASQALEIQHRCATTKANNGFGVAANFSTEIYTTVLLRRVA